MGHHHAQGKHETGRGRTLSYFRESAEGLVLVSLLLVGIVCGMLLERRLSAHEVRIAALEHRIANAEKRQEKVDKILFGSIGG